MQEEPPVTGSESPPETPRQSLLSDLLVLVGGIMLTGLVGFLWGGPWAVLAALVSVALLAVLSSRYWLWAVALIVLAMVAALFLPARSACREAARRATCINNLKLIGLALHNYRDQNGCFPPPYVADAEGKPLYSWRVLLLPYLEENPLYEQWHLDEPWDSPHNRPLAEHAIGVFRCPLAEFENQPLSSYLAVVGPGMAWEHGECLTFKDFTDAANATIMVVEVRDSQVHWAAPVDLDRATMSLMINAESRPSIGSHHPTLANVLFVDGSAMALPNDLPEDDLAALLTRGGGESIARDGRDIWRKQETQRHVQEREEGGNHTPR